MVDQQAGRRGFIKGAGALAAGAAGALYVKPELQPLGVAKAFAASSSTTQTPPWPGGGLTPGFWLNQGSGVGVSYWNQTSDPQWSGNGAAAGQPFATTTLFNAAFFAPYTLNFKAVTTVNGNQSYTGDASVPSSSTMYDMLNVGNSQQADPVGMAARQAITSVLNAAFYGSPPYAFTVAQVVTLWNNLAGNANSTTQSKSASANYTNDYKKLADYLSGYNNK